MAYNLRNRNEVDDSVNTQVTAQEQILAPTQVNERRASQHMERRQSLPDPSEENSDRDNVDDLEITNALRGGTSNLPAQGGVQVPGAPLRPVRKSPRARAPHELFGAESAPPPIQIPVDTRDVVHIAENDGKYLARQGLEPLIQTSERALPNMATVQQASNCSRNFGMSITHAM